MSVFFATPCYGGALTEHTFRSALRLVEVLNAHGIEWTWFTLGNESLIPRARNTCAATFLGETDYKYLMFVDADIEFTVDDFGKLYHFAESDGMEVVCGVYRMKKPGSRYAAWRDGEQIYDLDRFGGEPITVDYAGTGFLLIARTAFEKIRAHEPDLEHDEGQIGKSWAFFDTGVVDGFYCSEDYWFCRTWRRYGEVWMLPDVRLIHHGQYAYGAEDAAEQHRG